MAQAMVTIDQLGTKRPCDCGEEMSLGVSGEVQTPHGQCLSAEWICLACGRKEFGGIVYSIRA